MPDTKSQCFSPLFQSFLQFHFMAFRKLAGRVRPDALVTHDRLDESILSKNRQPVYDCLVCNIKLLADFNLCKFPFIMLYKKQQKRFSLSFSGRKDYHLFIARPFRQFGHVNGSGALRHIKSISIPVFSDFR